MNNPNTNLERLSAAKIREDEKWLATYGISLVSGLEQEFYTIWNQNAEGDFIDEPFKTKKVAREFKNSPFIERFYKEGVGVYEVVIGRGNGKSKKPLPHEGLKPSAIARASNSTRNLLKKRAQDPKYNIAGISYDDSLGHKLVGQHSNISVWDTETQAPLFVDLSSEAGKKVTNELTICCVQSMLEAQHALIAMATQDSGAFKRFSANKEMVPKSIKLADYKSLGGSIILKRTQGKSANIPSFYMENRLFHSDMSPYLTMLITTAGVTQGIKKYFARHHIRNKDDWERHLQSKEFLEPYDISAAKLPEYKLPQNQQEAIEITEMNNSAKSLIGENLYDLFCRTYKNGMNGSEKQTR